MGTTATTVVTAIKEVQYDVNTRLLLTSGSEQTINSDIQFTSGNTLEIRVKMQNNSSSEYLRIDDIIVTGDISGTYSFNTPGVVDLVYIYGTGNCANNDTTQVTIHNVILS